jgi:hypothetical protein
VVCDTSSTSPPMLSSPAGRRSRPSHAREHAAPTTRLPLIDKPDWRFLTTTSRLSTDTVLKWFAPAEYNQAPIPSQLSHGAEISFLRRRCLLVTVAKTRQFVKPKVSSSLLQAVQHPRPRRAGWSQQTIKPLRITLCRRLLRRPARRERGPAPPLACAVPRRPAATCRSEVRGSAVLDR